MADAVVTEKTIKIDGKEYSLSGLSENARAQVNNLQVTDAEIRRMQTQLAIYQTARMAYAKVLKDELRQAEAH